MTYSIKQQNSLLYLLVIGLAGWLVPGGGYYLLNEPKRALLVLGAVMGTFVLGIYVGSIGVVDPVTSRPWYIAQVMTTPAAAIIGHISAGGMYPVYGKPAEIGQLYTGIAGLLNLLAIINCVYMAYLKGQEQQCLSR